MRLVPNTRFTAWVFVVVLGLTGCASGGASTRPAGSSSARIVEAELENLHQLNALDAIRRLRPTWLQTRTGAPPMAHVNGNIIGTADELISVRAEEVQEMVLLSAADATTRFGTNYVSGVIIVTTKR